MRVYNRYMNIASWLKNAITTLTLESGTAELDAEVLLAHVLGVDRSWLHAHQEFELDQNQVKILGSYVNRRALHEPMAYILEKTQFYGREFYITSSVLVPRPESEAIIDLCKLHCKDRSTNTVVIDVGTGSGALAVTAALEIHPLKTIAIDIDASCLGNARINAEKMTVAVELLQGDLLNPVAARDFSQNDVTILANLPYVPDAHTINDAAMREPKIAIFGGVDGLDLLKKLFEQAANIASKSTTVITESLPFQHTDLVEIANQNSFKLIDSNDFIQMFER